MTLHVFFRQAIVFFVFTWIAQNLHAEPHMIVVDPAHSHAAAVFAQPIAGVSDTIHLYAPPGPDAEAFLRSISAFNHRSSDPTHWHIESSITPGFLPRMLREPPGNIVVLSGKNRGKIQVILSSLRAGQNVLADKPWIIDSKDFPLLETALAIAERQHLAVYDGMTERFNVAYQIQRELLRDPAIFGQALTGTPDAPAVELQNLHSLVKFDHGNVSRRPAWFLDIRQQGEAIADVGTHLVDLDLWTLFPDQAIDYRRDVHMLRASRSPIFLTLSEFERLTGEKTWPPFLHSAIKNDRLEYDCNNTAVFSVRGIYAAISDRWEYESPGALSDSYLVLYRGSRATIRVRQSAPERYVAEIDVIPNETKNYAPLKDALERRFEALSTAFPGLSLRDNGPAIRVQIPPGLRERGGSSFAQLVARFLQYARNPQAMPSWEKPDLLAKYYITTKAVELAQRPN